MKYIFLDIDGVLNHQSMLREEWNNGSRIDGLCQRAVECLNNLTTKTGAKIIVSSTWRIGRTVDELRGILAERGVTGDIVDKTPELRTRGVLRGNEIYQWMKDNIEDSHDFKGYIILDDDSDMLYWQRNNMIIVDHFIGLTPSNVYKAQRILEGKA